MPFPQTIASRKYTQSIPITGEPIKFKNPQWEIGFFERIALWFVPRKVVFDGEWLVAFKVWRRKTYILRRINWSEKAQEEIDKICLTFLTRN